MDVLDHGYVKLIETWGSDERIIESARMSTDKGFIGWGPIKCETPGCMPIELPGDLNFCKKCNGTGFISGDERLLKFLYEHNHTTPFEMGGATFEIQAPIFVFREWHRHRTQSYNEMSARYIPLPDVNYVPTVERLMAKGGANKQATSTGNDLGKLGAEFFITDLMEFYTQAQVLYLDALEKGVPKELARLVIPVGRYSKMRASANLLNWIRFLRLRCDKNAQWEIQEYANAVLSYLAQKFPRTMQLFNEESNGS